MFQNKILQQFFELVRAGLFPDKGAKILAHGESVDWGKIYQMAEEQSIVGLVAAGIDAFPTSERPPQEVVLQFIGSTLQLEQRNKAMNEFVAQLISLLRKNDVYSILVKGQGIAQCYEKPLWRTCGDVDLLLSEENYEKAKAFLMKMAVAIDEEDVERKHLGMTIDGWVVELHGTLHTRFLTRLNRIVDNVQQDVFLCGNVRSWVNGSTQVFLPSPDNDVFFVFSHILQHYFGEGVGLRQICDWCRLLYNYRESLNHGLLEQRMKRAGIMTEWKTFAAVAVDYLGMPTDAMPLYSSNRRWSRKGYRVMEFIIESGNFGHNRDNSYRGKSSFIVRKAISLWRLTRNTVKQFMIFPLDSVKVWWQRIIAGFSAGFKRKGHE